MFTKYFKQQIQEIFGLIRKLFVVCIWEPKGKTLTIFLTIKKEKCEKLAIIVKNMAYQLWFQNHLNKKNRFAFKKYLSKTRHI